MSLTILAAIFSQYFNKKVLVTDPPSYVAGTMFLFNAIFGFMAVLLTGTEPWRFGVFCLGTINAIGAWLFCRAVKVGLSQTMLFLPLTRVSGVILTAVFLGEWLLLDPRNLNGALTLLGTALIVVSAIFFSGSQNAKSKDRQMWTWSLVGFVLLFGLIDFIMKYFALANVAIPTYLFSWYSGALMGSFIPRIFEREWRFKIKRIEFWDYFCLSFLTFSSLLGIYWALLLAPATLVFPIQALLYCFGSLLIGLFIFKERSSFGKKEWTGTIIGLVGTILLLVGLYYK